MFGIVKNLLAFASGQPLMSREERADVESYLNPILIGGKLISDPKDPYVVLSSYVVGYMREDRVKSISGLRDSRIAELRDLMTAVLGTDEKFAVLIGRSPDTRKTLFKDLREKTVAGRTRILSRQSGGRSGEDVIQMFGLKPVDPLRLRE